MKEEWTWKDYELIGSPTISFEDYRIKAYGRDEEIAAFVDDLARYSVRSTRMLRRLVAYWGSGKSTFLYNVCYQVNKRLFFGDEMEDPKQGLFRHVLAFFVSTPVKRANLLDSAYNDGLPWPWDPSTPRPTATEKGNEAWRECLRKIAFVVLRRAVHEITKRHLEKAALGGSKLRKDIYHDILSLNNVRTSDFILKMTEKYERNDQKLEEAGEIMRFYIRMLLPSIEIKRGLRRIVDQEVFEQQFPKFLYQCYSSEFLHAYRALFSAPDLNLRYFLAFEKLLKMTHTFLLLVFDEVEDWSLVVRQRIDRDLHDIVVDAESPLSLVLIFRSEVLRSIRSNTTLGTFMTIHDRLDDLEMKQLDQEDFLALTASILNTVREGEPKIYPLTEDFIKKLANLTKRGGSYNVRTYLRALKMILTESLKWKRKEPLVTEKVLENKKADAVVKQALRAEHTEAIKFIPMPKRLEE